MGQRLSSQEVSWTPTATADTTDLADTTFHAIQGGVSTQRLVIREVYMGGVATASAPALMIFARDSQVGSGSLTVGRMAVIDAAAVLIANPPVTFNTAATNQPQRSSTLSMLTLGFNAFGGIVRWVAAPGEEITTLGASASLGELSLSAFTGGTPGLMNSHVILEVE